MQRHLTIPTLVLLVTASLVSCSGTPSLSLRVPGYCFNSPEYRRCELQFEVSLYDALSSGNPCEAGHDLFLEYVDCTLPACNVGCDAIKPELQQSLEVLERLINLFYYKGEDQCQYGELTCSNEYEYTSNSSEYENSTAEYEYAYENTTGEYEYSYENSSVEYEYSYENSTDEYEYSYENSTDEYEYSYENSTDEYEYASNSSEYEYKNNTTDEYEYSANSSEYEYGNENRTDEYESDTKARSRNFKQREMNMRQVFSGAPSTVGWSSAFSALLMTLTVVTLV